MNKKISVVIPTYNKWDLLKFCILSIFKQTIKPVEVIVIDNGSTDQTSEKIKKSFPQVKLISLKKNTGVTGGRNAGIKALAFNYDYVLFFDHDMVADKKMLEELLKVVESDDKIGIVTPTIFYWKDKKRVWSAGTGINLWTGRITSRSGTDKRKFKSSVEVEVAPAAIFVKKELLKKIKKFDDRYFATYEDTDFCFRAREVGYKIYNANKAIGYHDISANPRDEAERLLSRAYWVGRNRIIFMKDFGKNLAIFYLFLPFYILYYLSLAIKFGHLNKWIDYMRGTFDGLVYKND